MLLSRCYLLSAKQLGRKTILERFLLQLLYHLHMKDNSFFFFDVDHFKNLKIFFKFLSFFNTKSILYWI